VRRPLSPTRPRGHVAVGVDRSREPIGLSEEDQNLNEADLNRMVSDFYGLELGLEYARYVRSGGTPVGWLYLPSCRRDVVMVPGALSKVITGRGYVLVAPPRTYRRELKELVARPPDRRRVLQAVAARHRTDFLEFREKVNTASPSDLGGLLRTMAAFANARGASSPSAWNAAGLSVLTRPTSAAGRPVTVFREGDVFYREGAADVLAGRRHHDLMVRKIIGAALRSPPGRREGDGTPGLRQPDPHEVQGPASYADGLGRVFGVVGFERQPSVHQTVGVTGRDVILVRQDRDGPQLGEARVQRRGVFAQLPRGVAPHLPGSSAIEERLEGFLGEPSATLGGRVRLHRALSPRARLLG